MSANAGKVKPSDASGCPFMKSGLPSPQDFDEQCRKAVLRHVESDREERLRSFVATKGRSAHVENIKVCFSRFYNTQRELGVDVELGDEIVQDETEADIIAAMKAANLLDARPAPLSKNGKAVGDSALELDDEEAEILRGIAEWEERLRKGELNAKEAVKKEEEGNLQYLQDLINTS